MKNPWMKFYPADWRADPALRTCSIAARGLWIDMLAIMHDAKPYGSLLLNGQRIDKKRLAVLCAIPESECTVLLLELEGMGIFSRDDDGTIFSRRMRRDDAKAEEGRRQINKRWGDKDRSPIRSSNRSPNRSPIPENADGPNTQKLEARSQKEDIIAEARASGFTAGSKSLADALWKALDCPTPLHIPPELAGADWRAMEWEKAGWTPDLVDVEARRIGPGKPLVYYEKCFATAFAKRQAPLPIVEIRDAEKLTVGANYGKPKSAIIQAADDLCRKIASFDGPSRGTDELRSGAGKTPPRLLSHG